MAGQFDLGTASGTVRIEYESIGSSKVLAEMGEFEKRASKTSQQWSKFGQDIGLQSNALSQLTEIQKAHSAATKTAAVFEANLQRVRRDSSAGLLKNYRAETLAAQSRKSAAEMGKVMQQALSNLPGQLAKQGSLSAKSFADSFQQQGVSRGMSAAKAVGATMARGVGTAVVAGLAAAAGAVAVAAAGLGFVMKKGLDRSISLNTAEHRLKALGKTGTQTSRIIRDANEAVVGTQYGLADAANVASAATAAGIKSGTNLVNYLRLVADTASVTGYSLQDMGSILNSVQANQRAYWQDVKMLADKGIPIWENLAKVMGVSQNALRSMVTDGQVSAEKFQEALELSVGGAAQEMGKSFVGMVQNIGASLGRIGEQLIKPLMGQAGGLLEGVLNSLKSFETWLKNNQEGLIDFWTGFGKAALIAGRVILNVLSFISDAIIETTKAIGDVAGFAVQFWADVNRFIGRGHVADDIDRTAQSLHNLGTGLRENKDHNVKKMFEGLDSGWISLEEFNRKAKEAANTTEDLGDESEEAAPKVESLGEELEKLGVKQADITKAVEGSTEQFDELIKTLKDKGASTGLLGQINTLRTRFENGGRAVKNLASAMKTLADDTEDASTKAEKLISALKEIGLLPGGDAVASYNEAFREMLEYNEDLVSALDATGAALLHVDGTINTSTENGQALKDQIDEIQRAAYELAASEEADPGQVWENTAAGMRIYLQQFGIYGEEAEKLINKYLQPKADFEAWIRNAGDPEAAIRAVIKDPVKLQAALDLLTTTDDLVKDLLGPTKELHIDTVLDVKEVNDLPTATPPGSSRDGAVLPTAEGETLQTPLSPEERKRLGIPDDWPEIYPSAVPHGEEATLEPQTVSDQVAKSLERFEKGELKRKEDEGFKILPFLPGGSYHNWPGGSSYKERPLSDEELKSLENEELIDEILAQDYELMNELGNRRAEFEAQGKTLAEAYAEGILSGDEDVRKAIIKLAQVAGDGLGRSPAKYGPLSGRGWTLYRGKKFSVAFADGIASERAAVQEASGSVAGGAVSPIEESFEKFLGDAHELSGFAQAAFDLMTSLSDIMFSVFEVAQTISNGRLFGKNYIKDQEKLAAAEAKALQERELRAQGIDPENMFNGPPKRPSGNVDFSSPDSPGPNASKDELAKYIYDSFLAAGYSEKDAKAGLAYAIGESGLNPQISGGVQTPGLGAVAGFFQMTPEFAAAQGVSAEERLTAEGNVRAYLSALEQYRHLPMDAFGLGKGALASTSVGGPLTPEGYQDWQGLLGRAQGYINRFGGQTSTPARTSGPTSTTTTQKTSGQAVFRPGSQNTNSAIGMLEQYANDFGLTLTSGQREWAGTASGKSFHLTGEAGDFAIPGVNVPTEQKRAFAEFLRTNFAPYISELIYSDDSGWSGNLLDGQPWQYGQGTLNDHRNHVHVAIKDGMIEAMKSGDLNISDSDFMSTTRDIANNTGVLANSQFGLPALLERQVAQDSQLSSILQGARTGFGSDEEAISALKELDVRIAEQTALGTVQGKQTAEQLGKFRQGIMNRHALAEGPDTLGTMSGLASSATGVAGSAFAVLDGVLNSIAGAKEITGSLVRGIQNTEVVNGMIDSFQNFLELATAIGQLSTDVLGLAGQVAGIAGSGDPSGAAAAGALSAASSIAGIVTAVISAVNAGIDLAQEAYRIGTKHLARMMLNIFGMPQATDINYLLDTITGELKIYSSENPDYKTTFNTLDRQLTGGGTRQGPQNSFYIYQGPGQDPRDTMNDAMFAVRSSGMGVFGYDG